MSTCSSRQRICWTSDYEVAKTWDAREAVRRLRCGHWFGTRCGLIVDVHAQPNARMHTTEQRILTHLSWESSTISLSWHASRREPRFVQRLTISLLLDLSQRSVEQSQIIEVPQLVVLKTIRPFAFVRCADDIDKGLWNWYAWPISLWKHSRDPLIM